MSFFNKIFSGNKEKQSQDLEKGLEKTKSGFFNKITHALAGKSTVDEEVLDRVEEVLITSDVGLETTVKIIDILEELVATEKYISASDLNEHIHTAVIQLLSKTHKKDAESYKPSVNGKPYVILVVGVNGVGKTTTIGKLAYHFQKAGQSVVIGAADTFRAAAVDQLQIWSERTGCSFYSKGMGADPAAVAYETVDFAIKENKDIAIIDTAGRLHNKFNLMRELSKIKKSLSKRMKSAPHEVLLVLDATTGQNAIEQCKHFTDATEVTALALTKLDGTAKGGVAIGISDQFNVPIRYIGVGEKMDQLQLFDKKEFVASIFSESITR